MITESFVLANKLRGRFLCHSCIKLVSLLHRLLQVIHEPLKDVQA